MHQTLLRIGLPNGRPLWPDELRTAVARQDKAVEPLLMGRDANGQTMARPPVRFVGSSRWVGLVANPGYDDLLHAHVGVVIKAASQQLGEVLPVTVERHEVKIKRRQTPGFFTAMNVAMKRRGEKARATPAADLFVERLTEGIGRQALQFGLDCPLQDELEIANVKVMRQIGMDLKTDGGVTGEAVTLLTRVEFTMFADLAGIWFAGSLNARGYGRIVASNHSTRRA